MTTRVAYLRAINGLSLNVQREMARVAGCKVIYEHRDVPGRDSRDLFRLRLKPDDIAWVASLAVLAKSKRELGGGLVGADLSAFVMDIVRGQRVIEVATRGIKSTDPEFPALLRATLQSLHNATRDPQSVAASLQKARAARAEAGKLAKWRMPEMAEKLDRQRSIWQSARFTSDAEAIAALHPELRGMSPSTARRLFGCGRRPKRKGIGGKPSHKPKD